MSRNNYSSTSLVRDEWKYVSSRPVVVFLSLKESNEEEAGLTGSKECPQGDGRTFFFCPSNHIVPERGVLDRMGRRQLRFSNGHWALIQKRWMSNEKCGPLFTPYMRQAQGQTEQGNMSSFNGQHHPLSCEPFFLLLSCVQKNELFFLRDGVNIRIKFASQGHVTNGIHSERRGFPSFVPRIVFSLSMPCGNKKRRHCTHVIVLLAFQRH